MKKPIITAVACAALVAAGAIASPASASERGDGPSVTAGTPVTLADDLVTPLSLEVDRGGISYVSQNFAGILTQVDADGTVTEITSAPGNEIGAVSSRGDTIYYAQGTQDPVGATLMAIEDGGTPTELADLYEYEKSTNPDEVNTYGFVGLPQSCQDQFDPAGFGPAEYEGLVDSHPYASLPLKDAIYIADAGANAILRVDYDGEIETVAVLPPGESVEVTADLAKRFGFPDCAVGYDYTFEPVPTDVEIGPDGWLYVTSLPGGPEDASLGARGLVFKIDPDTGKIREVASGFVGATGLAVSRQSGNIYVAEMFGGDDGKGQVSVVESGSDTPTELIALTSPAAIELHKGSLYVTTDAFVPDATGNPQPIGKITQVPLTGGGHGDDSGDHREW